MVNYFTGLSLLETQELLCLAGLLLGMTILLLPQLATSLTMLTLYTLYLSLYQVGGQDQDCCSILLFQAGRTFLHFQWDILLLEMGFLALLLAPLLPNQHYLPLPQDHLTLYLVRWLLFRMMFASGVVKLTAGDKTIRLTRRK